MRTFFERVVLLLVAAVLLRTWCVQGVLVPCRVTGGSMALGLLGTHRNIVCADCGYRFACDADARPIATTAVCPNCGAAGNALQSQPDVAGDRVLLDRTTFHFRSPRRGEVAAFASPEDARGILIKRIVGLPGESVQIRGGDIYIDGQIWRKTLAEQHALMIPVHDAGFLPSCDAHMPARWQAEGPNSRWQMSGGRFTCMASGDTLPAGAPVDWLTYHHGRRNANSNPQGSTPETGEEPIHDDSGYNQSLPRRVEEIHPVTDLLLSFRLVESIGMGALIVRATDGRKEFQVCIEPAAGRCQLLEDAVPAPGGEREFPVGRGGNTVEVSLFDQQLLVAVDGRTVATLPYQAADVLPKPTPRPFAIGSRGLGVVLEDLRIFRDIYYTRPTGFSARWAFDKPYRLAADEYFVLGDNSPISADSRCWPRGPAINTNLLLGKPLAVLFPARQMDLGGCPFQVPELARIRYIR
jgi:signal peptidase I